MTAIEVTGLPMNVCLTSFTRDLSTILKGIVSYKNYNISELMIEFNGKQKAIITFKTTEQASKAIAKLDKYYYVREHFACELSARFLPQNDSYEETDLPRHISDGYRERSRSPISNQEAGLNLQLQLLDKRRLIMEEQRRLLVEQRRLEMIMSGVNNINDLEPDTFAHGSNYPVRQNAASLEYPETSALQSAPPQPYRQTFIPEFVMPCILILKQMRRIIKEQTQGSELKALKKLLRIKLRHRLALCLENQGYMNTGMILQLYRNIHSFESDEIFVLSTLDEIRSSHFPGGGQTIKAYKEKNPPPNDSTPKGNKKGKKGKRSKKMIKREKLAAKREKDNQNDNQNDNIKLVDNIAQQIDVNEEHVFEQKFLENQSITAEDGFAEDIQL